MSNLEKKSLSAENTFTDPYLVRAGSLPVFIHTEGTWEGAISVQIKHQDDDVWIDMVGVRYEDNFETYAKVLPKNCQVRAGFKENDYDSGAAIVRVMQ
jgi:hypothetical protein